MRTFILKHKKAIILTCVCLAYWGGVELIMHHSNKSMCPDTEYKIINNVVYCDYKGDLFKPKVYKRLIK